jgi:hypothetical protein
LDAPPTPLRRALNFEFAEDEENPLVPPPGLLTAVRAAEEEPGVL